MIEIFTSFRDALYHVLKFYQGLVEPVLGSQSYWVSIAVRAYAEQDGWNRQRFPRNGLIQRW